MSNHPWSGRGKGGRIRSGPSPYDPDKTAKENQDDGPDPTHECMSCNSEVTHIESSPTKDYRWCPVCERVTKWKRLDRQV